MGIKATITSDFTAVDLASMADDMLAEVVADFAQERFKAANRTNAVVASGFVPYTVSLNGRFVARGQGELLPRAPLVAGVKASGRRAPIIDMLWQWERLEGSALDRAVAAFVRADATLHRIQSAAEFARIVMFGERHELFRFLLVKYLKSRYPQLAEGFAAARDLYKMYRRVKLGQKLLGGGKAEAGEASADVLAWIAEALRDRSPVLTGAYRDAHELYADGEMIANAADVTDDMELPDADEFAFSNTVPYARKIEMGKTKAGRDFVIQVQPNVYERTAEDARSMFGSIADIRFEMRAVLGGEQVNQAKAARVRRPARAASGLRESRLGRVHGQTAHNNPDVRFPTIIVRFK